MWCGGQTRWQHRVLWLGTAEETQQARAALTGMGRESLRHHRIPGSSQVAGELEHLAHTTNRSTR